jgi:hypothetical protein
MMGELVPADPKQYRFDPVRRRIRAFLYSVQVGLGGPEKDTVRGLDKIAKAPADAKYVADVRAAVDRLARTVEEAETDLATLETDLRKEMKPLEAITKKLGAVAVPAASDIPGGDVPPGLAPPGSAPPGSAPPKTPAAPAPPAPAGDTPPAPAPMPPAGAPAKPVPATPVPAGSTPAPAVPAPTAPATPVPMPSAG